MERRETLAAGPQPLGNFASPVDAARTVTVELRRQPDTLDEALFVTCLPNPVLELALQAIPYVARDGDVVWYVDLAGPDTRTLEVLAYVLGVLRKETQALGWVFDVKSEVINLYAQVRQRTNVATVQPLLYLNNIALRQHQIEAQQFVINGGGRALIAHEMRLGKTSTSLASAQILQAKRIVVICPEHVRTNWLREVKKWTPHRQAFIYGYDHLASNQWVGSEDGVLIVGYASVWKIVEAVGKKYAFSLLIVDESQYCKSKDSERTKAVRKLARRAKYFLALSGTPEPNRPIELHPVLRMIDEVRWKDRMAFAKRYCGAKHNGFGWDVNGASNLDELHRVLSTRYMHRKRLRDVGGAPDRERIVVPIDLTNRKEYDAAADTEIGEIIKWVDANGNLHENAASALTKLNTLRQIAYNGKISGCTQWIADKASQGHKLVIFTYHKGAARLLTAAISKAGIDAAEITGKTAQKDRDVLAECFRNGQFQVLVLTLGVGATGIDLSAADDVVLVEFDWTPGVMLQAEARIDAVTKTGPRRAWYLVAADTLDELFVEVLHRKAKIIDRCLDGTARGLDPDAKEAADSSVFADVVKGIVAARRENELHVIQPNGPAPLSLADYSAAITASVAENALTIEKLTQVMAQHEAAAREQVLAEKVNKFLRHFDGLPPEQFKRLLQEYARHISWVNEPLQLETKYDADRAAFNIKASMKFPVLPARITDITAN